MNQIPNCDQDTWVIRSVLAVRQHVDREAIRDRWRTVARLRKETASDAYGGMRRYPGFGNNQYKHYWK